MKDKISFIASLPPIQSAIQLNGLDGARIKLDVPENEMPEVMKLVLLKSKAFRVTITQEKEKSGFKR